MTKGPLPKGIPDDESDDDGDDVASEEPRSWSRRSSSVAATRQVRDPGSIRELTESSLRTLEQLRRAVAKRIASGKCDASTQREAASLARAIIQLGSEDRQQAKFYDRSLDKLTDEAEDRLVIDYIQELPPLRREKIRAALAELDEEGAGLLG